MKAALVALAALFAFLVAFNNVTDYDSNFQFVQHVLTMDTTFEGNRLMWRHIDAAWIHHLAYAGIIGAEFLTSALCALGAVRMFTARSAGALQFQQACLIASLGLVVGIFLWFGGFITIGAEWFLMWQSDQWNGQQAAFRFTLCLFACLIFINLPEPSVAAHEPQ